MTSLFDSTLTAAAKAAPVAAPVAPVRNAVLGDDTWVARSSALTPDVPVTITDMVRPFHPWQSAAYLYATEAIARWGGALLGDDMGLGKTAVLLALAADAIAKTGKYGVVVAPPVTEGGWMSELKACFPNLTFAVLRGHKRHDVPVADVYFISDDSRVMATWLNDVVEVNGKEIRSASPLVQGAAIVVRDELHRDKGTDGKHNGRSRTMLTVGNHCRQAGIPIVGATGTLLTNRPVEGYLPLQTIGGEALVKALSGGGAMTSYLWRYCAPTQIRGKGGRTHTKYGMDINTALELHENLRRSVYVRREKSDLGEGVLPNSGYLVTPLALPDHIMARYQKIASDFYNLCYAERGKAWADKVTRAAAIVQMGMLREEAGIAKVGAAADYIADLVAQGEQVVVFYEHKSVHEKLGLALLGKGLDIVSINGQVTGQKRTWAIEDFQAGDAHVCLAQTSAAGLGVTLTAACHAVYMQLPWSSGSLKQASDRILRCDDITAQRAADGGKVTWHVLQACFSDGEVSFDGAIWSVLLAKSAITDAVNAGRAVTIDEESLMYEMMLAWEPSAKRHAGGF